MPTTSRSTKKRFLIKAVAEAIRRNITRSHATYPTWAVVNGANPEQALFVWNIKGSDFESRVTPDAPLPDGYGHSIAFLMTSNDVAVQLEPEGEFVNLSDHLEAGVVQWAAWSQEYKRTGLDGCS